MAVDYGNDYATILDGGELVLDLSPIRITGPIVPVVRCARAWLEVIGDAIETTRPAKRYVELEAQCVAAALGVDHVLAVERISVALSADKTLSVSGDVAVGGDGIYPLNVSIGRLSEAFARIGT